MDDTFWDQHHPRNDIGTILAGQQPGHRDHRNTRTVPMG
ncbi:hypothetical protein [Micromonospora sp. CB01531]